MEAGAPVVLVVMGVSGCGKSRVGRLLAQRLGWAFQEGDDLHPAANVAKMRSGIPLDDEDRWPWLDRVATWIEGRLDAGESGVVTCSALKRAYRDRLPRRSGVVFVYLATDRNTLEARLVARTGHYMPEGLLASQIETLEEPGPDETVIRAEADAKVEDVVEQVLAHVLELRPRTQASTSWP